MPSTTNGHRNGNGALAGSIRGRRQRLGLSQRDLARLAGVSHTVVHHAEHGNGLASAATTARIGAIVTALAAPDIDDRVLQLEERLLELERRVNDGVFALAGLGRSLPQLTLDVEAAQELAS